VHKFLYCVLLILYSFTLSAMELSPDVEYQQFARETNEVFVNGNFKKLEILAAELRSKKTRFLDGRWKLTAFYEAMHPLNENSTNEIWDDYEKKLKKWVSDSGNVPTPHVALASYYVYRAWMNRGTGYANTVTDSGRKKWQEYLALAKGELNGNTMIGQKCPHWYSIMQDVATGEGWLEDDFEKLYEQAVKKEPTYYSYYFSKANFYQSRWYGSKDKLMKFVGEAVKKTFNKEGNTLYARIYWSAEREFGQEMFLPGNVDWKKMKSGFDYINKHYPKSMWNQNAYAHFACRARDKKSTAEALKKISNNLNLGAWKSEQEFNECQIWALEK
jgi:hypothetical protein